MRCSSWRTSVAKPSVSLEGAASVVVMACGRKDGTETGRGVEARRPLFKPSGARGRYDRTKREHEARAPMLINCVAYQNGRKLADIPIEDISEYVSRPDCFVWVALFEPSPDELAEMAEEFGLHELAVEDAQQGPPAAQDRGIRRRRCSRVLHTIERDTRRCGELPRRRGRRLRRAATSCSRSATDRSRASASVRSARRARAGPAALRRPASCSTR